VTNMENFLRYFQLGLQYWLTNPRCLKGLWFVDSRQRLHSLLVFSTSVFSMRVFYADKMYQLHFLIPVWAHFILLSHQSGQEDDEDDVAVDDGDFLNEDELAELQRDEENIKKEVNHAPPPWTFELV